jgi:small subunit ribosomal protein S8e
MGISRSGLHKKRPTGGKRHIHRKKRKFELGRPSCGTKLTPSGGKETRRVRSVRVRGGNLKWRALRLSEGNYSWGTEHCTRKSRLLDVMYNATSNELIRTKTLVKGAVIQIDCAPFRAWYERHYGIYLGKVKKETVKKNDKGEKIEPAKISRDRQKAFAHRGSKRSLDKALDAQFKTGRLLARIASRPGQVGYADGYILEGKELEFYQKKIEKKKTKK